MKHKFTLFEVSTNKTKDLHNTGHVIEVDMDYLTSARDAIFKIYGFKSQWDGNYEVLKVSADKLEIYYRLSGGSVPWVLKKGIHPS